MLSPGIFISTWVGMIFFSIFYCLTRLSKLISSSWANAKKAFFNFGSGRNFRSQGSSWAYIRWNKFFLTKKVAFKAVFNFKSVPSSTITNIRAHFQVVLKFTFTINRWSPHLRTSYTCKRARKQTLLLKKLVYITIHRRIVNALI